MCYPAHSAQSLTVRDVSYWFVPSPPADPPAYHCSLQISLYLSCFMIFYAQKPPLRPPVISIKSVRPAGFFNCKSTPYLRFSLTHTETIHPPPPRQPWANITLHTATLLYFLCGLYPSTQPYIPSAHTTEQAMPPLPPPQPAWAYITTWTSPHCHPTFSLVLSIKSLVLFTLRKPPTP